MKWKGKCCKNEWKGMMTLWHCDTITFGKYDTKTVWHWHYDIDTITLWNFDTITLWQYDTMTLWHYDTMMGLWDDDIKRIVVSVGPETVTISGLEQPLSSGRDYRLSCSSSGSVPPARLSWWRGGRRIRQYNHKVSTGNLLLWSVRKVWVVVYFTF